MDRQLKYLVSVIERLEQQVSDLESQIPTTQEREWLRQRTKDAENLEWLQAKVRRHAPWLIPVAGVVGAAFVWFSSNTINIVHKP